MQFSPRKSFMNLSENASKYYTFLAVIKISLRLHSASRLNRNIVGSIKKQHIEKHWVEQQNQSFTEQGMDPVSSSPTRSYDRPYKLG